MAVRIDTSVVVCWLKCGTKSILLVPSVFKLVKLLFVQNRKELCNLGKFLKHALFLRSRHD